MRRALTAPWPRGIAVLAVAVVLAGVGAGEAWAHAALTSSDPVAGAALGDTPTAIRLTFTEKPQASLSSIRIVDANGKSRAVGKVAPVPGDPLSVIARTGGLGRGVYTVTWRIVSAVDGHATSGAYAFGVGVTPTGPAAVAASSNPAASRLEMVSRWAFLAGLVLLLGAAFAGVAGYGGRGGDDLRLAAGGWLLAAGGLVILAVALRRNTGASATELLHTPVGHSLAMRAAALVAAGVALLLARRARGSMRRLALGAVALAALAAMVAHVAAGHAEAGPWPHSLSVGLQSAHFAAAGLWIGGLAALLLGLRGEPSADKAAAVRRFSIVAAAGLVVVVATGTARAVEELPSWGDLFTTGYGWGVGAKIVLVLAIAALAAWNRLRNVPASGERLGPLRRVSGGELAIAAVAIAVAALLGSLAPPAAGLLSTPPGIDVSGSDARSTVQVQLSAASAQPGPNRFVLRARDFRTHEPAPTAHVTLRFTPLDDPGVAPTSLALALAPGGIFVGSGANMVFDGRWGVTALVELAGRTARIPLELDTRSPAQFVSIERAPGRPAKYTVEVGNTGFIRVAPHPERVGRSTLFVNLFDVFGNVVRAKNLALTTAAGDGPARRQPVRRAGVSGFIADADLAPGRNTVAVVATTTGGVRMRAVLPLDVPRD